MTDLSPNERNALTQTFQFMSNIDAEFDLRAASLDDRGEAATLEIPATYRFMAEGDRQEAAARLVFELRRVSGVWRIVGMDSR